MSTVFLSGKTVREAESVVPIEVKAAALSAMLMKTISDFRTQRTNTTAHYASRVYFRDNPDVLSQPEGGRASRCALPPPRPDRHETAHSVSSFIPADMVGMSLLRCEIAFLAFVPVIPYWHFVQMGRNSPLMFLFVRHLLFTKTLQTLHSLRLE